MDFRRIKSPLLCDRAPAVKGPYRSASQRERHASFNSLLAFLSRAVVKIDVRFGLSNPADEQLTYYEIAVFTIAR